MKVFFPLLVDWLKTEYSGYQVNRLATELIPAYFSITGKFAYSLLLILLIFGLFVCFVVFVWLLCLFVWLLCLFVWMLCLFVWMLCLFVWLLCCVCLVTLLLCLVALVASNGHTNYWRPVKPVMGCFGRSGMKM